METNVQLWYIMREYISSAEVFVSCNSDWTSFFFVLTIYITIEQERGVDPTELISFLLELSFHTLGAVK